MFWLNLPYVIQGTANHFKASRPAPPKMSSESKNKMISGVILYILASFSQIFTLGTVAFQGEEHQ